MRFFSLFLAVCTVTFFACQNKEQSHTAALSDSKAATAEAPKTSDVNLYEGLFVTGAASQAFIDCKSGDTYWLDNATHNLSQQHPALVSQPYDPTYVRISARPDQLSKQADSLGYKKQLQVVALTQVNNRPRGECFAHELVVHGSKPNWAMQIISQKTALFKSPFATTYTAYDYAKPTTKGDTTIYSLANNGKQKLGVKVYPRVFVDPVSKKTYTFTADITEGNALYRGGAELPAQQQANEQAAQKAKAAQRNAGQKTAAQQKNPPTAAPAATQK